MAAPLGVGEFMSERWALTNICGNRAATIVIAVWEGELDPRQTGVGACR